MHYSAAMSPKNEQSPRRPKADEAYPPFLLDYPQERFLAITDSLQDIRPACPAQCLHFHRHYELLYITKGRRDLWMHGREYSAQTGDLIVFRPEESHMEYAGTKAISYFVYRFYPEELSSSHLEFPATPGSPILSLPHKPEFVAMFNKICAEFERQGPDSQLLMGAYLVEFLVKLRRAVLEGSQGGATIGCGTRERIQIAATLLQEDVSGALSLEKLARRTSMSSSHFAHSFKSCVGESPRRYQIHERIKQAKALLLETNQSATEIAQQLGYTSPYFFFRQFRTKTGYTTSEFRSRFR
jgi:AraC-like DNA-binding protein/mannose-6-phosphate isomerase-like protein (cupin superfamily)